MFPLSDDESAMFIRLKIETADMAATKPSGGFWAMVFAWLK
jgi:hypothetical protein